MRKVKNMTVFLNFPWHLCSNSCATKFCILFSLQHFELIGLLLRSARSGFIQQTDRNRKPWKASWSLTRVVGGRHCVLHKHWTQRPRWKLWGWNRILQFWVSRPLLLPNHSKSAVWGNPRSTRLPIQFYGPLPLLHVFTTTTQSMLCPNTALSPKSNLQSPIGLCPPCPTGTYSIYMGYWPFDRHRKYQWVKEFGETEVVIKYHRHTNRKGICLFHENNHWEDQSNQNIWDTKVEITNKAGALSKLTGSQSMCPSLDWLEVEIR